MLTEKLGNRGKLEHHRFGCNEHRVVDPFRCFSAHAEMHPDDILAIHFVQIGMGQRHVLFVEASPRRLSEK